MRVHSGTEPQSTEQELSINARWLAMFEDRHGAGAYDQLRGLLERPCVTYAQIAARFGVTRECVRQWHKLIMPDAPRGHARQRICGQLRQRKRLLANTLFRAFFTHARRHGREHRLELVRSATGYRSQSARLDGHLVALREARPVPARVPSASRVFAIAPYRGPAAFVYVRLGDDDYLFLPAAVLSSRMVLAVNPDESAAGTSFRNSFAALWDDMAAPVLVRAQ